MRFPRAIERNHRTSTGSIEDGAPPDTHAQRRFQALLDPSFPAVEPACRGSKESKEHEHPRPGQAKSIARSCASNSIDWENALDALATPMRVTTETLRVRLANGPLAGWEIEAHRYGDHISIRMWAIAPLSQANPPSSTELANTLSKRLGLRVSVEYCDAPAAEG